MRKEERLLLIQQKLFKSSYFVVTVLNAKCASCAGLLCDSTKDNSDNHGKAGKSSWNGSES